MTSKRNRYTQNGILMMLDRNRRIKAHPERFQEINGEKFDLIFTVEERIYDTVLEGKSKSLVLVSLLCLLLSFLSPFLSSDLAARGQQSYMPVHVINIDVQDNHEEATLGAFLICELCEMVGRAASIPSSTPEGEAAASIFVNSQYFCIAMMKKISLSLVNACIIYVHYSWKLEGGIIIRIKDLGWC